MTLDNSLFDAAFDAAGLRETVTPLKPSFPAFQARFDRPQQIIMDEQIHTTDYAIEYTTSAAPNLARDDELSVGGVRYRVKQKPMAQGDGYWTIAQLEPL